MKNKLLKILFIGFLLRLILLFINLKIFTLPQGEGDAKVFELHAHQLSISDYGNFDLLETLKSGGRLYEHLLSLIYLITGRNPFILGFTNVLLGTFLIYLTYKATLLLWNDYKIAYKATYITALFPLLMVESALTLREIPIMVFMMLGIIAFIKFWKYKKHSKLIWFLFFTFISALFHSGMLFILFGFLIFVNFNSENASLLTKFFSVILVLSAIYFMNQTEIGTNKIGGSFDKSIELLQKREQYDVKGGSHYPEWMRLSGGSSDFIKIPIRYITFLFSPLIPWLVRSVWHTVGLLDAFLYLYMFFLIWKYREIFKYSETAKAILIMALLTILVFSLGATNVGTAIRHRAKIAPLLIILAVGMNKQTLLFYKQQYAIALKKWQEKKRKI